jgi:hypothetical protein
VDFLRHCWRASPAEARISGDHAALQDGAGRAGLASDSGVVLPGAIVFFTVQVILIPTC